MIYYWWYQSTSITIFLSGFQAHTVTIIVHQVEILDQRLAVLNDLYSFLQTQLEVKHSNKLEALQGSSGVKQKPMGDCMGFLNMYTIIYIYIYIYRAI